MSIEIYDIYKEQGFEKLDDQGNEVGPNFEDEIAYAYFVDERIKNFKRASEAKTEAEFRRANIFNPDGTAPEFTPEQQENFRLAYEQDKDYNPRRASQAIYERYAVDQEGKELPFMDAYKLRKSMNKVRQVDFEDYQFSPGALNAYGLRVQGDGAGAAEKRFNYGKETVEDYAVDLPLKVLGNTGEALKFVYDSPKYFLDDRGDEIWDAITYATPGLNAIKAASELAIAGGNWAQYEAHLKENPHLAQSLEFAGEMLLTLPLEGVMIAKMTSRLGRRNVLNKLDKSLNTKNAFFTDSIKKWYAKGRLQTANNVRTRGLRNTIKEQI